MFSRQLKSILTINKPISQLRHGNRRIESANTYTIEWNIATQNTIGHTKTSLLKKSFKMSLKAIGNNFDLLTYTLQNYVHRICKSNWNFHTYIF